MTTPISMQLKEIVSYCKDLPVCENRCLTDDFYEVVFFNADIDQWMRVLEAFLGPARKAAGQEPTDADLVLTAKTGSIRIEQTLFEKEFENGTVIAKLWPWKDGVHTTLRMAMLHKA